MKINSLNFKTITIARIAALLIILIGAAFLVYGFFANDRDIKQVLTLHPFQKAQIPLNAKPRTPEIGENAKPSGSQQESEAAAAQFVTLMGMMAGSVSKCSVEERKLITECGQNVLADWNKYSGEPEIESSTVKKNLETLWTKSAELGASYSSSNGFSCGDLLAQSKQAPVWKFCTRPDAMPADKNYKSLRLQ